MAFFDIGINVNVNLGSSLTSINSLQAALSKVPASATTSAASINQVNQAANNGAAPTNTLTSAYQRLIQVYTSTGQTARNLGSQFSATVAPIQQLTTSTNQLGLTTQNYLQRITGSSTPLGQFNSGLQQMNTQFQATERSGSRFAELFRGNRGLIFGLSATFGTITGVIFELQLMDEANSQVAESQARVNELIAQGKEGTGQYQQAQQALGKDMRFLEFTTRNLALALTNFIPDVILVTNGILQLRDKLTTATTATRAFAVETRGAAAAVTALNVAQGGGGLLGRFAGLAAFAGPIGLAIAGISAVIGFATLLIQKTKEMDAANIESMNASKAASEAKISDAQAFTEATLEAWGVHENSLDSFLTKHTSTTDSVVANYQRISTAASNTVVTPGQKVEDLGIADQSENLDVLGGIGDWFAKNMGDPFKNFTPEGQDKTATKLQGVYSGTFGSGGFNEAEGGLVNMYQGKLPGYARSVPSSGAAAFPDLDWATTIRRMKRGSAELGMNATMAGGLNIPGLGQFPITGLLSGPEWQQIMDPGGLREQADAARSAIPKIAAGQPGAGEIDWKSEEAVKYFEIISKINDITSDNTDITENNNNAKEAEAQKLKELTAAQNEHNQIVDRLPRILQETGQLSKIRNNDLLKEQQALHMATMAYVDYDIGIGENVNLQKAIVAEGNRVVTGLYEQRDAIQGANIFWEHMNDVTQEQIAITQEQSLASIDVTQALTNQVKQQYLINNGLIEGRLAAQQFIETTMQNAAANREYEASISSVLEKIQITSGHVLGDILPANIKLTREEMESLYIAFKETGTGFEELSNIMNSRLAPAFETFNGITAGMKDEEFRNAFKEIDFGDLNKEAWRDIKNMGKDMADIATEGNEMLNVINALIIGVNNDSLKNSTLRQGLDEFGESLQRVIDIDPDGESLSWFPKFLDDLSKGEREFLIKNHGDALQYLAMAISDKDLTPYEVLTFYEKLGLTYDTTKTPLENYSDATDKLKERMEALDKAAKNAKAILENDVFGKFIGPGTAVPGPDEGYVNPPSGSDEKKEDPSKTFKTQTDAIRAAAQAAQTALKNLAEQGSNSISILIKNIAPHVKTMDTYFRVTVPVAAQATQTSLANLSNEGVKSIAALIAINNVYDQTVAQIMIDVGLWQEVNDDLIGSLEDVQEAVENLIGENNILARTIVQVGNNLEDAADSANEFEDALADLEDQARQTRKELEALADVGGGGGLESAQGGFHTGRLDRDTIIMAHKGESVDIGPGTHEKKRTTIREGGTGTINITVVTHNELDGERIGTTVTRRTFKNMSTR